MDRQAKGKEMLPQETVAVIQAILEREGLETVHCFLPGDIEGCVSSRVTLAGKLDCMGANGKGTDADYCTASAYAELIERLQNRLFAHTVSPDDPLAAGMLPAEGRPCDYQVYTVAQAMQTPLCREVQERVAATVQDPPPGISPELVASLLLEQLLGQNHNHAVLMAPFYSTATGEYELLPETLMRMLASSNGMAAGNSLPEAIVQAYSEVFERHVMREVVGGRVVPPEIPRDWVAQNHPDIAAVMARIEADGSCRVMLRDCSLGRGIPVVCGLIADTRTGGYGIRFGAHPLMAVALERTFTELFQGHSRDQVTRCGMLVFDESQATGRKNVWNIAKTGSGNLPPAFFAAPPDYPFTPWEEPEGEDNAARMFRLTELLEREGGAVYVSDVSYLGFPAVSVYVPGYSEIARVDEYRLREKLLLNEVRRIMRNLAAATEDDVRQVLRFTHMCEGATLENTYGYLFGLPLRAALPGSPMDLVFLRAACAWRLGDAEQAAASAARCAMAMPADAPGAAYVHAAHKFLQARSQGAGERMTETLIYQFFGETGRRVLADFTNPETVLARLYPACNGFQCGGCPNDFCCYPQVRALYEALSQKMFRAGAKRQLHRLFAGYSPRQRAAKG